MVGTRSTISAYIAKEKVYVSVYCQWDGYLSHNGRILRENYTTEAQVIELLQHGGISSLKETLGECEFYHRDRGEELTATITKNDRECVTQEYAYLFKNGKWYWQGGRNNEKWKLLTEKSCK